MKNLLSILFIIITLSEALPQETQKSTTIKVTQSRERVTGKIYNKLTGEKLDNDELFKIMQKNPYVVFEHVIDKYGKIERYYYDPNNTNTNNTYSRNADNQTRPGETFPAFVFETIDGDIISSDKLKGSWVIIRFELFADTRFFRKKEIEELDNQINGMGGNQNIVSIICFADYKDNVKTEIELGDSNFKLVGDGRWLNEKFNNIKYPTTLIVENQGRVVNYYYSINEIELNKILK